MFIFIVVSLGTYLVLQHLRHNLNSMQFKLCKIIIFKYCYRGLRRLILHYVTV